jgi:hypothetical protein
MISTQKKYIKILFIISDTIENIYDQIYQIEHSKNVDIVDVTQNCLCNCELFTSSKNAIAPIISKARIVLVPNKPINIYNLHTYIEHIESIKSDFRVLRIYVPILDGIYTKFDESTYIKKSFMKKILRDNLHLEECIIINV